MDLRQLRYFISVAENLNFTEAAKQLFVAQSAVSQQIKELEEKIGVKLLKRNKRNVELTIAGIAFLKEAKSIVSKSLEAIEIARQADSGIIGHLNIGFLNSSVNQILPPIVRTFRQKYPLVNIKLNTLNHGILNDSLKEGFIDIGFTTLFGLENIGGVEWKKVRTESHTVVIHSTHPLANRPSIHLSELANEPFVTIARDDSPQAFDRIMQLCANSGFSPNIVSQTSNLDTVLLLVESGLGISILPNCLENIAKKEVTFLPIEGVENHFDIVAAWNKENTNPAIPHFIEELDSLIAMEDRKSPLAL